MTIYPINGPALTRFLISGWLLVTALSACSILTPQDGAPDKNMDWDNIPDASPQVEPLSKTGNPPSYVVDGQRYYVSLNTQDIKKNGFSETGIASWYGTKFHGNLTSSGEPYDMYKMTAAHKTLPIPSYVSVKNLENNKQVVVKVNDRGPFVDGRIIDLSYAAAQKLEVIRNGTARVELEVIAAPQISGATSNDTEQIAYLKNNPQQYFVQMGAFSEINNAEKFRAQLISQSIKPTIIKSYSDANGEFHKVQVGPLTSTQDLQLMESRLSDLGYTQLYIISE